LRTCSSDRGSAAASTIRYLHRAFGSAWRDPHRIRSETGSLDRRPRSTRSLPTDPSRARSRPRYGVCLRYGRELLVRVWRVHDGPPSVLITVTTPRAPPSDHRSCWYDPTTRDGSVGSAATIGSLIRYFLPVSGPSRHVVPAKWILSEMPRRRSRRPPRTRPRPAPGQKSDDEGERTMPAETRTGPSRTVGTHRPALPPIVEERLNRRDGAPVSAGTL
jgi:hypothetical protein